MLLEQGPIRPPSEATSLLLRVNRNCPWNKCAFCHAYKNQPFQRRSREEVLAEIDVITHMVAKITELSHSVGAAGNVPKEIFPLVARKLGRESLPVAWWLHHGGRSVFLQDGNALTTSTKDLVEIISRIKERFPFIDQITTYARSKTAARKTLEELQELKTAGLTRVHVGMESGCAGVLTLMHKGASPDDHLRAGAKIKEAGLSLSEYVILGLGGREFSACHSRETASLLNTIQPDFIRLRTLAVTPDMPLASMVTNKEFIPMNEDEIVLEEKNLIEYLEGSMTVLSDHNTNLLLEINGRVPEDKSEMLKIIEGYLTLDQQVRKIFQFGRRHGLLHRLSDLTEPSRYQRMEESFKALPKDLETVLREARGKMI